MADHAKEIKFSRGDYLLLLIFAVVFDLFSFIPFVGSFGVLIIRIIFWFKGVKHKRMTRDAVMFALIEFPPFISWFPGLTFFVMRTYKAVKKYNKVQGKIKQDAKLKERAMAEEKREKIGRRQGGGSAEEGAEPKEREEKGRKPGVGEGYGGQQRGEGVSIYDLDNQKYRTPYAKGSPLVEGKPYADQEKQKRAA